MTKTKETRELKFEPVEDVHLKAKTNFELSEENAAAGDPRLTCVDRP